MLVIIFDFTEVRHFVSDDAFHTSVISIIIVVVVVVLVIILVIFSLEFYVCLIISRVYLVTQVSDWPSLNFSA